MQTRNRDFTQVWVRSMEEAPTNRKWKNSLLNFLHLIGPKVNFDDSRLVPV